MDKCGAYALALTHIITFATKSNPDEKKRKDQGKTCCYVDVPADYKTWTKNDLKTLATSPNGTRFFDYLTDMTLAAIKRDAAAEAAAGKGALIFTEDAKCAQQALTALAPDGNWYQYIKNIAAVADENKAAIVQAHLDKNIQDVDSFKNALIKKGAVKLKRQDIEKLANDPSTYEYFQMLVFIAQRADELDASGKYTANALYRQKALQELSPNGDWRKLYNDISMVETAMISRKSSMQKSSSNKEDRGAVDFNGDTFIGMSRVNNPAFDQQAALKLLEERGVQVAASHDLQAPIHIQAMAAVKKLGKSVTLAA